jgi:hypothetical protein
LWDVVPVSAAADGADLSASTNNPIIADVDGNGSHEVLIVVQNSVTVLRGTDGAQLTSACNDGSPACQNAEGMFMWYPIRNTPAVDNLDNSGDDSLEIVAGGTHTSSSNPAYQNRAFLYAWRDADQVLTSPAGPYPAYSAPWPMFHGNPQHTGVYPQLVAPLSAGGVVLKGTSHTYPLSFERTDGAPFNWTIVENDPSGVITLNRTSGSASDTLDVTFHAPATPGVFNATLTVQSAGLSPVTIQLRFVSADEVFDVYLPLIQR